MSVFQLQNDAKEFLAQYFDSIPHYLFRTSSPRSNGSTSQTCVMSAAVKYDPNQDDLMARDKEEATEMLKMHLLWKDCANDNLVSWTSSLLFAVQHAIRRQATDRPASSPDSIYVTVLDTRKLPRNTFLPAIPLLQMMEIPSEGKLTHSFYHGEYLSQGKLDLCDSGATVRTTLEVLIRNGIYELYPPFADEGERTKLWRRVRDLRANFRRTPEAPSKAEIEHAERLSIACCPRTRLRPIIMMFLLSLKRRPCRNPQILEAFRESGWGRLDRVLSRNRS